jgi:hypothetical protein
MPLQTWGYCVGFAVEDVDVVGCPHGDEPRLSTTSYLYNKAKWWIPGKQMAFQVVTPHDQQAPALRPCSFSVWMYFPQMEAELVRFHCTSISVIAPTAPPCGVASRPSESCSPGYMNSWCGQSDRIHTRFCRWVWGRCCPATRQRSTHP